MKEFLINILSGSALFSTVLVISSKNPVIAVIFLISTFLSVAGYLIVKGIGFIGITYIIVYVGAIAVLFLFVIMMINIKLTDILETGTQYTKNLPIGLCIAFLFLYEIYTIIPFTHYDMFYTLINSIVIYFNGLIGNVLFEGIEWIFMSMNPMNPDTLYNHYLEIEAIGQGLYTNSAFSLILVSILLLLSMIAPIFISKKG